MTTTTMTDLEEQLAALRSENEALKRNNAKINRLSLKVSAKGAVSLYGMGRFPVTLYQEQWEKLFGAVEQVKAFIAENSSALKTKE